MSPGHGAKAKSVNCLGLVSHHKHHPSDQRGFPVAALSQVLYLPPPFSEASAPGDSSGGEKSSDKWEEGRGQGTKVPCLYLNSLSPFSILPDSLATFTKLLGCPSLDQTRLFWLFILVCTPVPSQHLQSSVDQGLHSLAKPRTLLPG